MSTVTTHHNIFSTCHKWQFVLNSYCILVSVFLVYFYLTYRSGGEEFKLKSNTYLEYSSQNVFDNSNQSSAPAQVTPFKPALIECETRANLKTQPNVSIPMCIYDPTIDLYISANISRDGEWDPVSIRIMQNVFQQDVRLVGNVFAGLKENRHFVPKGDDSVAGVHSAEEQHLSLLDLGCNIGAFTLTMASMGYQVLAVDAMEESLQLLATSLRMNNLTSLVTLVNNAVSDRRGPVHVQVNINNRGASFIKQDQPNSNISTQSHSRKPVSAVCLDDLLPYVRTGRVFMKMDIEGFESKALQCAGKLFSEVDVLYVYMEWVFHRKNYNGAHIIDFMSRRNFLPYQNPQSVKSLEPSSYLSWPDDVLWIKRKG